MACLEHTVALGGVGDHRLPLVGRPPDHSEACARLLECRRARVVPDLAGRRARERSMSAHIALVRRRPSRRTFSTCRAAIVGLRVRTGWDVALMVSTRAHRLRRPCQLVITLQ